MASPTQWTWVWVNSGSWWWTGRPGVLQSMGSQRVRHDWVTWLSDLTAWLTNFLVAHLVNKLPAIWEIVFDPWFGTIPWRRKRLPFPVFWPGEFHGLYSPLGCKELDTTEWLSQIWYKCKKKWLLKEISISAFVKLESILDWCNESLFPKKFSHHLESSRTYNRFFNLGFQQRDWETPQNLPLKAVGFHYRTSTGLGKQTLVSTNKTLCAPGESWSFPTIDWARLSCECPGVSGGGMDWQFGLRPNNREGTQPNPPIENWIKDLQSVALPIKTRPSFPQSVSPIRKLP